MATTKECAALAALVYNPPGMQVSAETLEPPAGWSMLMEAPQGPATCGFHALAYVNAAGDSVLSFKGPDFFTDALNRSQGADEFITNLALNMGLASFTDALVQATRLFAQVRHWALRQGRDTGRIVFTGHGVGGGIASVMAVWFNQPCTVFAQAPLRAVAVSPADFIGARAVMESMLGASDGAARSLQAFVSDPLEMLPLRERRVTHWHVRGDVLQSLRSRATAIVGTEHVIDIDIDPCTVDEALALHSMSLHAALLYEPRLRLICKDITDLFPLLTHRQHQALISSLINDQHRMGLEAEGALGRLATDLEKVRNPGAASSFVRAVHAAMG